MGEVAELLQNLVELFADVVESLCDLWIRKFAGQADPGAKCDQMLLSPVIKVALGTTSARARHRSERSRAPPLSQ